MKKLMTLAMFVCSFMFGTSAQAQIPTTDVANLLQQAQQLTQLKQQYDQMKQQYESFSGSRGMGNLLGNMELRKYLPAEWQTVYDNASYGNYGGASGAVRAARDANKVLSDADRAKLTPQQRAELDRQRNQSAVGMGMTQEAYKQSSNRIDQLGQLVSRINTASDPKAIMDLQARIQAEQTFLQNENIKLQLMGQMQLAEQRMNEQRSRERFMKTSGNSGAKF